MSATARNRSILGQLVRGQVILSAIVVVFCSCQTLPGTLQLEKPGPIAQAARDSSASNRREVVAASETQEPKSVLPSRAPAAKVEAKSPPQEIHGDVFHVGDVPGDPTSGAMAFGAMAAPHCPTCSPGGTCPTGPASLPASAFVSPGCFGDASGFPSFEEWVCNGGDNETAVIVHRDWRVFGLHQGDTVVHYDTLDGKTHVQPSNEVCLYTPRFAAVRKVYGIVVNEQHDRPAGVELPIAIVQSGEVDEATTVVQPLQPGRKHAIRTVQQFRERQPGEGIENHQRPATAQDQFLPFENLTIIRRGIYDNKEKAILEQRLEAAIAWTHDQAPQILIDNKTAVQIVDNLALQSTYTYEIRGHGRVHVCKIASKQNARPGDTVDFTIRFDNVGDQVIGNVTLLDRLHERLELVPNTQSCTLKANFSTEDEDGSPRVLRWDIVDPLPVGKGGIVRFQCRVR